MRFAGVVVIYNPDKSVLKNIDSYIDGIEKLYVVDNSEDIDNSKMFKNKKIEYIRNGSNLGIAEALNIGSNKAIKDGFDWILTMDQDSRFYKDHIFKMINYINNNDTNDVGIVSPFHSILQTRGINYIGISEPLLVMTSGNLVNLKAYEKHLLGKTMYVSHHSPLRRYYMVRNRHYLYDLYHEDFPEYCVLELGRTKRELLKVWLYEKNKLKKSLYMYRGYRDYKKGIVGKYGENEYTKK